MRGRQGGGVLCQGSRVKYQFIQENKADYTVQELCKAMQVSVSSYYRWLKRPQSPREQRDKHLSELIIQLFHESKGRYGAPRIHATLRKLGERVDIKRIKRLMQEHQLQAKARRKPKATTDSQYNLLVTPNLLQQQFSCDKPNKVWASDITFIPTQEGWLYLAVIINWAFPIYMLGKLSAGRWITHDTSGPPRQLVIDALHIAYWRRKPLKGLIHHSDKGS